MSLPGSPLSSSGDDFAALLDFELQTDLEDAEDDFTADGHEEVVEGGLDGLKHDLGCDQDRDGHESVEELGNEGPEMAKHNDANCPPHPGFMWGVCIRCGVQRAASETEEAGVALRYIHEGLELTEREAARLRTDELQRLKACKKLYLVLDLDHTLLNSARFVEVSPEEEAYCTSAYSVEASSGAGPSNAAGLPRSNSSLHKLVHLQMWTKLRPYVHRFLEEASKFFEMYVYTMGERIYALAMARLLDPTGRFFGERVISQGDSTRRTAKDLDVVLGAESAVIILDDTEGVWPKHGANLVLMERYHFFSSSCRQFGIQGKSLSEAHKDESELEGTLATALKTLLDVHHRFYSTAVPVFLQGSNGRQGDPLASRDVSKVLEEVRSKILKGCRIVFSRIFPTTSPLPYSKEIYRPENHDLWRLTERLGAECSRCVDESTTHVVALDKGTDKARWAKSNNRFLVHPRWVEAALYLWRKPAEEDFPVADDRAGPLVTTFVKTVEVHPGGPHDGVVVAAEEVDGQGDDKHGVSSPCSRKRCLEEEEVNKEQQVIADSHEEKKKRNHL